MGRGAGPPDPQQAGPRRRITGLHTAFAVAVLLAVAVVALVMAVALPVNQLTQPGGVVPVALAHDAADQALGAVDSLPDDTYLEATPDSTVFRLQVAMLPWSLRLLTEAPAALRAVCVGLGALALARLLLSFRDGRPFDRQNPRLLVALAVLLLAGGVGGGVLDDLVQQVVLDHVGAGSAGTFTSRGTVDLTSVVLAVVLLALADVFRRGRQLDEDVQGLV